MTDKRLVRPTEGRVFLGVAAGLADYFNLDPTLVRIGWVALGLLTHFPALLVYLVLAFLMPEGKMAAKANAFDAEEIVVKDAA
ncbi:MAG: PspC domain-containing protein [Chloroflexota bacterium]